MRSRIVCARRSTPRCSQALAGGAETGELLEQLALLRGEATGQHNLDTGEEVAGAVAFQVGHALAGEAEGLGVLRLWRDGEQETLAVRCGDGGLAAEDGHDEQDGNVHGKVVAFALVMRVGPDGDDEIEIAARAAAEDRK